MKNLMLFFALFFLVISCSKDTDSETPTPTPTVKYTLTITAGSGGSVDITGGEYEKGTSVTVTADPNTGYEFEKWSDNNTDNPRTILVNSDTTLEARFKLTVESVAINKIEVLREQVLTQIRNNETVGVWAYTFDFEGDNDDDLLLIRSGELSDPKLPLTVYKNIGDSFEEYKPGFNAWGRSVVFDDINGDGLEDIFFSDHGYDAPPFPGTQDQIIFQESNSTLIDVTSSIFPEENTFSHGSTILDLLDKKVIIVNIGTTQKTYLFDGNRFNESDEIIYPNISEGDGSGYGHPTINGEFRLDLWYEPINALWSDVGDLNNDGYADLIIGTTNRKKDGEYNEDQQRTNYSTDPYGNSVGKSEIILFQNTNTGKLEYSFPESVVTDSKMEGSDFIHGVIGILTADFNSDGCTDYATYTSDYSNEHFVSIKLSNCNNEFEDVQRFVLPEIDFLWEDFDLVDVEDDGDIDIIISNNIQWGSTYESINEHKVILNDNGSFSIRSGNKSDIPYLPPHIALSWPTE